jgi:sulfate ABC transporter permease subunit
METESFDGTGQVKSSLTAGQARGIVPAALLVLVLLPLLLMPLAAIFVFAFRGGWAEFWGALSSPDARFAFRFSLLIAFSTGAVNAVLGTFAAYVLSKYRFPGREPLGIVVNIPVAIPTVVIGTSLLLLWGPVGLLGGWLAPFGLQPMFTPIGVLLAHIFVTFPYMLGVIKPLLDQQEVTYEEAAFTMGATRWQTFRMVILPALRRGLLTGALLTFAHSLGEFGATVMVSGNLRLRTQTAPLYVFAQFEAGNIANANALAAILALLSFVIFFFLLRIGGGQALKGES